ncbi:hypothetical protein JOF47_000548 [Paeniglutamicibacter kerguelensis]|uniref:Uncharacterized protein n=1 Tax=Paeniglutamicibacter kerguelensis TaxID=254788 RepID=A0ABS4X992_9MICC|nr:hypothetical protein [Paeniglutamicibacter kerguelensis]
MPIDAALFSGTKCFRQPLRPRHPWRHRTRHRGPRLPGAHLQLGLARQLRSIGPAHRRPAGRQSTSQATPATTLRWVRFLTVAFAVHPVDTPVIKYRKSPSAMAAVRGGVDFDEPGPRSMGVPDQRNSIGARTIHPGRVDGNDADGYLAARSASRCWSTVAADVATSSSQTGPVSSPATGPSSLKWTNRSSRSPSPPRGISRTARHTARRRVRTFLPSCFRGCKKCNPLNNTSEAMERRHAAHYPGLLTTRLNRYLPLEERSTRSARTTLWTVALGDMGQCLEEPAPRPEVPVLDNVAEPPSQP